MKKQNIGLIGLGVMGQNLALNMESKGYRVAVFNRTIAKTETEKFAGGPAKGKNILPTYSEEEFINSAEARLKDNDDKWTFNPGQDIRCVFGDEQGDVIGYILDYMLRDGGNSESFSWIYDESLR
jgi:6-phosphogluconate dehydrogenase (decarboxylating)